ncbi:MAG: ABC transporter permease [SAR324 cluster bacterium]|nr:ABC transporter permease [SAR324 cluster bacterium]
MVKSGRINLNTPLTLTAPTYLWLAFTVFLPLSAMFFFSFLTDAPFGNKEVFFSLENYQAIWDKTFYQLLLFKSFRLGLEVTVLCFLIGFPCALILAKHVKGYWREAIFVLIILPFWSNALVRIFSWTMVLRGNGVIEMTLNWISPGFGDFSLMFTYQAILIGLVHSYLPYMILTCYVSIQSIDDSIIEAARVLGASRIMILMRLIIPLSLPGIAAGSVLIFIPVVGSFMEPRILGGREGTFIGTIIEDQFTRVFNWPLGAALSFLMLFIILIIIMLSNRFSKSLR